MDRKREREWSEEDFQAKLEELVEAMTPTEILAVPGVRELVAEELNNEVIDALEEEMGLDDEEPEPEED